MKLLLLGATGLVGGHVLQQALAHSQVSQVIAPVRRPLAIQDKKLKQIIMRFEQIEQYSEQFKVDAVICALGTTQKKAGSKAAFRQVDLVYPLHFAQIAQQQGVQTFVLNSAMGSNPKSKVFYNQAKGELEHALIALNFKSLTFVRPGLIDGERDEFRLAESIGLAVLKRFDKVLPDAFKVNPAENIAAALLDAAINAPLGTHIVPSTALIAK